MNGANWEPLGAHMISSFTCWQQQKQQLHYACIPSCCWEWTMHTLNTGATTHTHIHTPYSPVTHVYPVLSYEQTGP